MKFILFGEAMPKKELSSADCYHALEYVLNTFFKDCVVAENVTSLEEGVVAVCIRSWKNIGSEEEPVSYERHPVYLLDEGRYNKLSPHTLAIIAGNQPPAGAKPSPGYYVDIHGIVLLLKNIYSLMYGYVHSS